MDKAVCAFIWLSNQYKQLVHEKHEKHEKHEIFKKYQTVVYFVPFVFFVDKEERSVTRARPRHPVHRMPFESWREACFAFPGTKKEMARLREPCFVLVPRRGLGEVVNKRLSAYLWAFISH